MMDLIGCVLDAEFAGEETLGALGMVGGFDEVELCLAAGVVFHGESRNNDINLRFLQFRHQAVNVSVIDNEDVVLGARFAAKDDAFVFSAGFNAVDDGQTNAAVSSCNCDLHNFRVWWLNGDCSKEFTNLLFCSLWFEYLYSLY